VLRELKFDQEHVQNSSPIKTMQNFSYSQFGRAVLKFKLVRFLWTMVDFS